MMPAYAHNRWSVLFFVTYLAMELYFLMNLVGYSASDFLSILASLQVVDSPGCFNFGTTYQLGPQKYVSHEFSIICRNLTEIGFPNSNYSIVPLILYTVSIL